MWYILVSCHLNPVDTGRKLNVQKTFRRRPGRLLNVLCTFNLHPVSTGNGGFVATCFVNFLNIDEFLTHVFYDQILHGRKFQTKGLSNIKNLPKIKYQNWGQTSIFTLRSRINPPFPRLFFFEKISDPSTLIRTTPFTEFLVFSEEHILYCLKKINNSCFHHIKYARIRVFNDMHSLV